MHPGLRISIAIVLAIALESCGASIQIRQGEPADFGGVSNFEQLNERLAQGNALVNFTTGPSYAANSFRIDSDSTRFVRIDSNMHVVVPNSQVHSIELRNHLNGALQGAWIGLLCGAGLQLANTAVTSWLVSGHTEGDLRLGTTLPVGTAIGAILGGFIGTTDIYLYPRSEAAAAKNIPSCRNGTFSDHNGEAR
jgi:hypothetical protein